MSERRQSGGECEAVRAQLAALVDGDIARDQLEWVRQHQRQCASCQLDERAQREATARLRRGAPMLLSQPLPVGLHTRCHAMRSSVQARAGWRSLLVPAALVAVLIVATAGALLRVATARSNALLAAELTVDHLKCFSLFTSGTRVSADPRAVAARLRTQYGFEVSVPGGGASDGLRLDGARRCFYGEGAIPHVMYQVHGHNVSLFILEGVSRRSEDVHTLGHRTRIWSNGKNTYVMVSSAAAGALTDVVGYVQRETR